MFNPKSIVIEAFLDELVSHYLNMFISNDEDIQMILTNAHSALEIIANSDAPYHDTDHTMMVTLVGVEILKGKSLMDGNVTSEDWVHFVISLLNHDIGYVRGICRADRNGQYAINSKMETVTPPEGATDAFLTPYHVDRGKLYIKERFENIPHIDSNIICENIERTRFPVPSNEDHKANDDMAGLIRAADLIGQLADPHYYRKISSLFAEFKETGQAPKMGYTNAADLRAGYPKFFWNVVLPYISEGIRFLQRTQEGQSWTAHLYSNVFMEEHEIIAYGPERRLNLDRRVETKTLFKVHELTQNDQRKLPRRASENPHKHE